MHLKHLAVNVQISLCLRVSVPLTSWVALKLATPHCCIQIFLDCVHPDPMADVLLMSSNMGHARRTVYNMHVTLLGVGACVGTRQID